MIRNGKNFFVFFVMTSFAASDHTPIMLVAYSCNKSTLFLLTALFSLVIALSLFRVELHSPAQKNTSIEQDDIWVDIAVGDLAGVVDTQAKVTSFTLINAINDTVFVGQLHGRILRGHGVGHSHASRGGHTRSGSSGMRCRPLTTCSG